MMTVAELKAAIPKGQPGVVIEAKYDGECGHCGQATLKGDAVLYLPADKCVLCECCARDGERP